MSVNVLLYYRYLGKGGRSVSTVEEGHETAGFWNPLGGKAAYASIAPNEPLPREPRLFQCCNLTGAFQVEEVPEFTQSDLSDDDVYLLDAYTAVFLWIGNGSNEAERSKGDEFVKQYLEAAKDGRDTDVPIIHVKAGLEPIIFTTYFVPWVYQISSISVLISAYFRLSSGFRTRL